MVFLTVNHCGPLPFRELHSTGETMMWRDPGGSWAWLPPVYKCNHPATVSDSDICGLCSKQHNKKRGALCQTLKDQTITRTTLRRPGPYKLLKRTKPLIWSFKEEGPARNSNKSTQNTYKWHLCKTGSFSRWITADPSPLELHSTETIAVERP